MMGAEGWTVTERKKPERDWKVEGGKLFKKAIIYA